MYQWGLERRSDNIDVLRSAPERSGALRSSSGVGSERSGAPELRSSGVAPERSEVVPESLVSVTSDQSIYDFYF